jgi:hypothetical protein
MTLLKRRGGKVKASEVYQRLHNICIYYFLSLYFHDFICSKAEH